MTAFADILGGMGQPELSTTSRMEAAWNRGDLDEMLSETPQHAEWVVAEENPAARTLRGPAEIRAYLEDWRSTVHGLRFEPVERLDAGDAVLTIGTISGHAGSQDGPEVTVPLAIITRIENGQVVRTEEYLNVDRAFEAAGLSR
jgi:ketosteroid isomerase-like protein